MRKRNFTGLLPHIEIFQGGTFPVDGRRSRGWTGVCGAEKGFETPPTLKAGEVLPAQLLHG